MTEREQFTARTPSRLKTFVRLGDAALPHYGDSALDRLAEAVRTGKPLTSALSPNLNGLSG
jgi:hypothetical protein